MRGKSGVMMLGLALWGAAAWNRPRRRGPPSRFWEVAYGLAPPPASVRPRGRRSSPQHLSDEGVGVALRRRGHWRGRGRLGAGPVGPGFAVAKQPGAGVGLSGGLGADMLGIGDRGLPGHER